MANPVYSRPAYNRFLGNRHSHEVHDLKSEKPQCQIDRFMRDRHAVVFFPDTAPQARREGYDDCRHCIGDSDR